MAWCPVCKSEYEDNVKICAECGVELKENLEEAVHYLPLVLLPTEEPDNLIKYLTYLQLDYQIEEDEEKGSMIMIREDQFETALSYVKVYATEKMKEKIDEGDFDAYEPEYAANQSIDMSTKVKELKSSAFSFAAVGILLIIFFALNAMDILTLIRSNTYNYFFILIGAAFFIVGMVTYKKVPAIEETTDELLKTKEAIIEWFFSNFDHSSYFADKQINVEGYDEGSLYFAVVDRIKEDIQAQFTEADRSLQNAAADEIYQRLLNHEPQSTD